MKMASAPSLPLVQISTLNEMRFALIFPPLILVWYGYKHVLPSLLCSDSGSEPAFKVEIILLSNSFLVRGKENSCLFAWHVIPLLHFGQAHNVFFEQGR